MNKKAKRKGEKVSQVGNVYVVVQPCTEDRDVGVGTYEYGGYEIVGIFARHKDATQCAEATDLKIIKDLGPECVHSWDTDWQDVIEEKKLDELPAAEQLPAWREFGVEVLTEIKILPVHQSYPPDNRDIRKAMKVEEKTQGY